MDYVFFSVGSFEQHGPHLPYETDSLIADAVAKKVAKKIKAKVGGSIDVGVSTEHMDFPGTKTLSVGEFKKKITKTLDETPSAFFVNAHGGNNRVLDELRVPHVNLTRFFKPYDHAGEIETSIMLYINPRLVKKEGIRKHKFSWPDKPGWRMKDYSESGVLGDPTKADEKKGREYLQILVDKTIDTIRDGSIL
ncbi:MAG: hypothetical protein GF334_03125 [Candidatus Altiarchaeales archaeon]|nr:hypothetical protein [Candidatus Altiarchaeales archaeon]